MYLKKNLKKYVTEVVNAADDNDGDAHEEEMK